MPTLSLCVVARNEDAFIRRCLASARDLSDDYLVLDTGSTDLTRDIARATGARVVRRRWPGDYAAAFNLMRREARGEWILNLDADEVLDPDAPAQIRALLARPAADAYAVTIRNYAYYPFAQWRPADPRDPLSRGAYGWCPSQTIRLYRNDPRYAYTCPVHHTLVPSIRRAGGRILAAPFTIHHHGLLWRGRCGDKPRHYLQLAERKTREQPENGRAWVERGVVHAECRDWQAALDCFERARGLGYGAGAWYFSARMHHRLGADGAAVRALREAQRRHRGDDRDPDCDRADLHEYLGFLLERRGRTPAAIASYRRALAARPDSPVAANDLADLYSRCGERQAAAALIEKVIARYPGYDMPRATRGNILFRAGEYRAAEAEYADALAINPENFPARRNLARALQRQGRVRTAARAWRMATERDAGPELPAVHRRTAAIRLPAGDRPLVVSLVAHLGGGIGRVVVEVVRALQGYRHLVLCGSSGSYFGLEYAGDLRRLGATLAQAEAGQVAEQLQGVPARLVLHHWYPSPFFDNLDQGCPAPRVIIGHCPSPMPRQADAHVVISGHHRRKQDHLPRGTTYHIPNCVDLAAYRLPRVHRQRTRIAMLSRLDMDKFPRRLLAHLPDLRPGNGELVIAGQGPRRFEIEPELTGTPLERRVRFAGAIRSSRVPAFLATAQIGLHLTETACENCSVAVIEMLAAGLPVVSQPRGCLPEMVIPGENGYLAEDEHEIAAALDRLLRDVRLRRRLGAASRRHARAHYGFPRFAAAYRRLVRDLL